MIRRVISQHLSLLALFALLLFPVTADGSEEFAKLPYDKLLLVQDTVVKNLPSNQPFYLHIISSDPKVKNGDISLCLVSTNERIEIPLDKHGFIKLPIRRDLVGQNAYIISNQPKGTLVLQGESRSRVPLENRKIDYTQLISPVVAANSVKTLANDLPEVLSARYINSIELFVDQEGNSPVIIRSKKKDKIKLFPDECGNVLIPIEEDLKTRNTIVEFPSDNVFFISPRE